MKLISFILVMTILAGSDISGAQEPPIQQPSDWLSLMTNIKINESLDFCGEPVALDIQEVRERLEKELLLTIWDRPQVALWLKRSTRYLPIIERMLRENDMPDDLKYVAIIESALRPHAGSRKGAIGFWQF
ncbi:MAG: transglycosylase SLT domain-containing protein, partial [Desulfobacterales bacterium]